MNKYTFKNICLDVLSWAKSSVLVNDCIDKPGNHSFICGWMTVVFTCLMDLLGDYGEFQLHY